MLAKNSISDWRSCTNGFLQSIDRDEGGSGPACNFWECLHVQATKWKRGGLLTGVSNVLNPVCSIGNAAGHVPFLGDIVSLPSISSLSYAIESLR